MVDSPGGEHFGAEDLAGLADKALEKQALLDSFLLHVQDYGQQQWMQLNATSTVL
jgi:hypothetical protein